MHLFPLVKCAFVLLGFAARGTNTMHLGFVTNRRIINGNTDINGDSNAQNSPAERYALDLSPAPSINDITTNNNKNIIIYGHNASPIITKIQEGKSETPKLPNSRNEPETKGTRAISSDRNHIRDTETLTEPTIFSPKSDSQTPSYSRHVRELRPMGIQFPEPQTPAPEASRLETPTPRGSEPQTPTPGYAKLLTPATEASKPKSPTDIKLPVAIETPEPHFETVTTRAHLLSPVLSCPGPCEVRVQDRCKPIINCGQNEIYFPF